MLFVILYYSILIVRPVWVTIYLGLMILGLRVVKLELILFWPPNIKINPNTRLLCMVTQMVALLGFVKKNIFTKHWRSIANPYVMNLINMKVHIYKILFIEIS